MPPGPYRGLVAGRAVRATAGWPTPAVAPKGKPADVGPLAFVKLGPLMTLTEGDAELVVGVVDGPLSLEHPDLAGATIVLASGDGIAGCRAPASAACLHGTFVAGMLVARRGSSAPAICPGVTMVSRPIFDETAPGGVPGASQDELASAIGACVSAGARVVNVSAALVGPSSAGERELRGALDLCARRQVLVVAAAGNQGTIASSPLTRHPAVLPVVGCDAAGAPAGHTNLSRSVGTRGLRAPAERVTSLGTSGTAVRMSGTSVAAPFVSGTVALLWSLFPTATVTDIRLALTRPGSRRAALVPPLLDATAAHAAMQAQGFRRHRR